MSVIGVFVCGLSVGFFKRAIFGVDPFQALMSGLDAIVPISFGTMYIIASICLLSFSLILDRSKIGIATLINLFLVGYVVDFSHRLLLKLLPEVTLGMRILLLAVGIVVMCFASAFYFTADLGVSPYDAVSLIISEKCKIMPFKFWRITCDFMCVFIGSALFLLAGNSFSGLTAVIGIGTIITAFFMGPLIDFFNRKVAQPFLYGNHQ